MFKKNWLNKVLKFVSFLLAFSSLAFYSFYRIPFLSSAVSLEINKELFVLVLSVLAIACYLVLAIRKKESILPENRLAKIMLFSFPVLVILSVAFSGNFINSFFGKYVFLQSGVTFLALFFSAFIISSYFKLYERLAWLLFILGGLFITLPVIFGLIFAKFGMVSLAGKLLLFVESWDIVSVLSAILVLISLLYYEVIASSKSQKLFSGILVLVHLALLFFIIIPDIWYVLTISLLFVFVFAKKVSEKKNPFYKRLSFYTFVFSLLLSTIFIFSNSFTSKITNSISNFIINTSGINYSFIKPNFKTSADLVTTQVQEGRIFGSGPAEFYRVWQKNKPQSVINSSYWGVDFSSSFSALTTFAVTFGVVGLLLFLSYIFLSAFSLIKVFKNKNQENYQLYFKDDEQRFYFLTSSVLFIFATFLLVFFVNVILSFVLFVLFTAILLSKTLKWKDYKFTSFYLIFIFLIFLASLVGGIISVNKIRAVNITNKALANYQKDLDISQLENGLIKAARVSRDDGNYRLLSQFYLFKTRLTLNSENKDVELLQKEVLTSINNAIASAKTAISLDKYEYNNHITLGSVYTFLMAIDDKNKEEIYNNAKSSYDAAISLYPKNPSLFLNLADLEYAYNQNSSTIVDTIKKSLEVKPNYSSAYYLFSQLAAQNNDRDTALEFARQAIAADPQNVQAYLQFGILLLNKKDLSEEELNQAYTAFVSVLNLDPNNTVAAYYLSVTYIMAGEYDKASQLVNLLDQVLPENNNVLELKNFLSQKNIESPKIETSTSTEAQNPTR